MQIYRIYIKFAGLSYFFTCLPIKKVETLFGVSTEVHKLGR